MIDRRPHVGVLVKAFQSLCHRAWENDKMIIHPHVYQNHQMFHRALSLGSWGASIPQCGSFLHPKKQHGFAHPPPSVPPLMPSWTTPPTIVVLCPPPWVARPEDLECWIPFSQCALLVCFEFAIASRTKVVCVDRHAIGVMVTPTNRADHERTYRTLNIVIRSPCSTLTNPHGGFYILGRWNCATTNSP